MKAELWADASTMESGTFILRVNRRDFAVIMGNLEWSSGDVGKRLSVEVFLK